MSSQPSGIKHPFVLVCLGIAEFLVVIAALGFGLNALAV